MKRHSIQIMQLFSLVKLLHNDRQTPLSKWNPLSDVKTLYQTALPEMFWVYPEGLQSTERPKVHGGVFLAFPCNMFAFRRNTFSLFRYIFVVTRNTSALLHKTVVFLRYCKSIRGNAKVLRSNAKCILREPKSSSETNTTMILRGLRSYLQIKCVSAFRKDKLITSVTKKLNW